MKNIKEHFKYQLETSPPCSGDYLDSKTFDAAVEEFLASNDFNLAKEQIEEHVTKRMEEWKAHKGERLLFYFLADAEATKIEILRLWESELWSLEGFRCISDHTSDDNIPRFIAK